MVQLASAVAAWMTTRVEAIPTFSRPLRPSPYRFRLDRELQDGFFFVDFETLVPQQRALGRGENSWLATALVQVSYSRGGGQLGAADRQSIAHDAAGDAMRIADTVEAPAGYRAGVEEVRFVDFGRLADAAKSEIWQTRLLTRWRSDAITT